MSNVYFEVHGDVTLAVQVTEMTENALIYEIKFLDDKRSLEDLKSICFDLNDSSLADSIEIEELGIRAMKRPSKNLDVMVEFDRDELAASERRSLCFVMRHPTHKLSIDTIFCQSFGVALAPAKVKLMIDEEDDPMQPGFFGAMRTRLAVVRPAA